jgi:hypothetical protein
LCVLSSIKHPRASISLVAAVTEDIIRQLGFTEEEYRLFHELQISAHSVLLHCRRQVSFGIFCATATDEMKMV